MARSKLCPALRLRSAVKPISVDEGAFVRWNADPFDLDGGDGASETDPGESTRVRACLHGPSCCWRLDPLPCPPP